MNHWNYALSGAILLGYWAIGLFFFRFQRRSGDRFFGFFGWAFWLLTLERGLLVMIDLEDESQAFVYIIRLVAFLFILFAIYDKNRVSEKPAPQPPPPADPRTDKIAPPAA